ncbi:MAG TPA: VTT domain-containing protein [Bryobacteraceae bacterium]|nr:VTT domain-containing protein [Bryobacteraceae bacterium]
MSFRPLLLRHGYTFLFGYVFAVQAGMPIPADPLLLIMGTLAGDKYYSWWLSFATAVIAALAGDCLWFELGRQRGRRVLSLLCKMSLEPDTCVRKTETNFRKRGAWSLVFAKFIPGASLVSVPLAGASGMHIARFLLADLSGCSLWVASYLLAGKLFHRQIDALIEILGLYGQRAGVIAITLLAAYVAYKYFQRWRWRRELRVNRITPQEVSEMLARGCDLTVVDLRHETEIAEVGLKIPGALVLRPEDLRSRSHEIPDAQEVILYCS